MDDRLCLDILKMMEKSTSGEKAAALGRAIECVETVQKLKEWMEETSICIGGK